MPPVCRRLLSVLLLPAYLFQTTACSRTKPVEAERLKPAASEPVAAVVTVGNERIDFEPPAVVVGDTVFGTVAGAARAVPLETVRQVVILREGVPVSTMRSNIRRTGDRIAAVTLADASYVQFDDPGAHLYADTVRGLVDRRPYHVARGDVQRFWLSRTDAGLTAFATIGIAAAVLGGLFLIALATKESCPFIYSWDGERYVFDAEPYGGAIARGLERDDYGVLEHLRPDRGLYRLLVTNEVAETQVTNLLELWVVDHPPAVRVVADEWGRVHAISAPTPPASARDAAGRDLTPWLAAPDERIWEPAPVPGDTSDGRDQIVLAFPRPPGATTARLVARVGTGLWGSHMIRSMLELRGREAGAWYARVDGDATYRDSVKAWNVREELYALRVELETAEGWQTGALLAGGGPFVAEERVAPLRLHGVQGDTVRLRIRPPRGFWAVDAFALDFETAAPLKVDTLRPVSAVDARLGDILPAIRAADDQYHEMPTTADRAHLTFRAPPAPAAGLTRTVLVHARGWYQLHLSPGAAPDSAALRRLADEPGFVPRLAAELYGRHRLAQSEATVRGGAP
ncbi:MAG: hypothetical protein ACREOF_01695 [Gemmatimonadales bacterium]